jgi:nucleotide-binding universal stress UspA family protein
MVVIGVPFVEILKIARDLDLPMIVMGMRGHSTPPEEVLFGSTAEKVLRGSRVPVLCVPL